MGGQISQHLSIDADFELTLGSSWFLATLASSRRETALQDSSTPTGGPIAGVRVTIPRKSVLTWDERPRDNAGSVLIKHYKARRV